MLPKTKTLYGRVTKIASTAAPRRNAPADPATPVPGPDDSNVAGDSNVAAGSLLNLANGAPSISDEEDADIDGRPKLGQRCSPQLKNCLRPRS